MAHKVSIRNLVPSTGRLMHSNSLLNFLLGAGSILDLCPPEEPKVKYTFQIKNKESHWDFKAFYSPFFEDLIALRSDWLNLGNSLRTAITVFAEEEQLDEERE